ncbi:hypothetical protein Tco_1369489 [Tanacetum coccineum]
MSSPKFAKTHNVVAFLEKPIESDGFVEIIDFLKASSVHYALTVNPIIYTSCIEQLWATAKVQIVNGVPQLQALVDKNRVIITESSIRRDLYLDDAEGTDYLPTATIFEELAHMGYEKPYQKLTFYKAFFSQQWNYFIHTITQCLSAKSTAWNEFSSIMASLIIFLATNQKFNMSKYIFDAMTQRQEAAVSQDETEHEESVPTPSNDPQPSGCSSKGDCCIEEEGLEVRKEEDFKNYMFEETQESCIADIDADVEVTLVDETQESQDDELMFDSGVLDADEMPVEAKVDEKDEQSTKLDDSTAGEAVTTASVEDSAAPTTIKEITLAQTLIQIKAAKPKVVTTVDTTTTTTRPKAKGVVVQEPSEFRVPQEAQPLISKDRGKGIMVEIEVPLKRKDKIALDEQIIRDIQAKLDAELIEEQKLARK